MATGVRGGRRAVVNGDKSAQEALDEAAPAIQENLNKAWDDWNSQGT